MSGMMSILVAGAAGVLAALFVPGGFVLLLVAVALIIALLPQMPMLRVPAVVFALSVLLTEAILIIGLSRLA